MRLTPEALAELERFHATPVASVLRTWPRTYAEASEWRAVSAGYRAAFAALEYHGGRDRRRALRASARGGRAAARRAVEGRA